MPALDTLRERLTARPKRAAAVAAFAVALGAIGFGIGPMVRSRVEGEAARRGLVVSIGAVQPGFFRVILKDVDVRLASAPDVHAALASVAVDVSAALRVSAVAVRGGEVALEREPEDLLEKLRAMRPPSSGDGQSGGGHTAFSVEELGITWRMPSGASLTATGVRAARGDDGLRFGAASLIGAAPGVGAKRGVSLEIKAAEVELDAAAHPKHVTAESVAVVLQTESTKPTEEASAPLHDVPPQPPPLPVAMRGKGGKGGKTARGTPDATDTKELAAEGPLLPLPDLGAGRRKLAALARTLEDRVPEGLRVDVPRLSLEARVAGEVLTFGPAPFALERRGGRLFIAFTSDKSVTTTTPLGLELELPFGAGEVVARMSGGPVSLSALGVQEGAMGLFDVGKARVSGKGQLALAADGSALTFDVELATKDVSLDQPRLAPVKVRELAFGVTARGVLTDGGKLRLDEAALDMGALHVRARGTVEDTREHFALSATGVVAPAACQALLESAPPGLLPTVEGARMTGTLGGNGRIVFDTRAMDKLVLDYRIDAGCRMAEVSRDLARDRFDQSFAHRAYHPDGKVFDATTGPGTDAWTPLDEVSPFVVTALLTTEDGAFYKHKGFNHSAIRQSVLANLKARRFVRGASTITMQLAKNLFLSRAKNLSRKVEEVVLTDYLEQAFQKDELLELYLNVIEFGPDVYGVKAAAAYYFGRKPEELDVAESFFLASLLPSPVRYGRMIEKGQPSEAWTRHLRLLMEIAHKRGNLTDGELESGRAATVSFAKPGAPPPTPRRPFTTKRRDPYEDDAAWQPVE